MLRQLDETVRTWDAVSGEAIDEPLIGHHLVNAVAIGSANGRAIMALPFGMRSSGSGTPSTVTPLRVRQCVSVDVRRSSRRSWLAPVPRLRPSWGGMEGVESGPQRAQVGREDGWRHGGHSSACKVDPCSGAGMAELVCEGRQGH